MALIEAKLTEDDGTARDKVARVQHLAALSLTWASSRCALPASRSLPVSPAGGSSSGERT